MLDGSLERVDALNELGKAMFENVAPAAPEAALAALERTLLGQAGRTMYCRNAGTTSAFFADWRMMQRFLTAVSH